MIHDWMWSDLNQQLDSLSHVILVDRHPTREIAVQVHSDDRSSYLMRIKLHHLDGRTSSYQTQTVIDFELQGFTPTFPGFEQTRLEAGYEWDKETRTIGDAVISLRHGRNKIIWVHTLLDPGAAGDDTVTRPSKPGPTLPELDVMRRKSDDHTGTEQI